MSELLPVLETLVADAGAGRPAALCVVLRVKGSTPQDPGASMLVRADQSTVGTLGGGCVEAEVRRKAFEMLQRREAGPLEFVLDHDYGWDDGLICGGKMVVGVVPIEDAGAARPYADALAAARRFEPAWFPVVVPQGPGHDAYRIYLEVPPTLLIAGAGHVGAALARLAVGLDFRVVVIDDRADCAAPARFDPKVRLIVGDIASTLRDWPIDPSCFVAIVTRGHQHDEAALDAVVRRPAGYLGLIGSRRKGRLIFDDLRARGVTDEQLSRVRTPIGLAINAMTVPEIAVSIAAELVQRRRAAAAKLVEGPSPA